MSEHLIDGVLFRAAAYVALALALGPSCWSWCIERPLAIERPRVVAIVISLVIAVTLAMVQSTLTFAGAWSWDACIDVLRTTAYGERLLMFTAAALALVVAAIQRGSVAIVAASLFSSFAIARLGHAALESTISVAIQTLHVASASAWLGGLMAVTQQVARRRIDVVALRRFSRLAAVLVGIVSMTGALRTAAVFESAGAWTIVLGIKLLLVGGALAIAWGHRRKRLPALLRGSDRSAWWTRMETMLTLELGLVIAALLFAALLSQLAP